jgi:hypothetical protein
MVKISEWIRGNCRFAREKRLYRCTIGESSGETYAVSEQQAESFFWYRITDGNLLKQYLMKEKGYTCTCNEVPVEKEPPEPKKPEQLSLFPMGPDPFKR